MEIFRSKDADQDLREIYIFTRRTRGERQAERYFARLNIGTKSASGYRTYATKYQIQQVRHAIRESRK